MYKKSYPKYKSILSYLKRRYHYKRILNRIIAALIILIIILLLKLLNNSFSNNIIQIIYNGINYEFSLKKDGKALVTYGRKLLTLPEKTLFVFNLNNSVKYPPPIEGVVYNPFGETIYLNGKSTFNDGVDIIPYEGKEPIAIKDGVVKSIEDRGAKGYFVTIEHEDFSTVYGYLVSIYVEKGEDIKAGTKIGTLGTNKDGNKYLHFQTIVNGSPVDPLKYIDFKGKF
ncbi:M23 family metallopeptidase [Tepidimicrobium xylanilyticum]|uniref:Peptidase family M23 n=1 Tax=Tepidimicrobium xylanilyticum TaxID=1123352 RepID=A0A1H3BTZ7_9FIRM|nr:M23 family metallopeptidase [Tepidimicrobium xylanilyticum]GMG97251.1 hypothetical protein EN5CB1_20770 [Tepidimicrobium xylanilyticum]SDX45221.1 Peptidase family M23 [Tepidimicrobium xylanilyticum]